MGKTGLPLSFVYYLLLLDFNVKKAFLGLLPSSEVTRASELCIKDPVIALYHIRSLT